MLRKEFVRRSRPSLSVGSPGFSVLEMLITVAVIGIAVAFVIPGLLQQLVRTQVTSTANNIANLIQQTRLRAIRDNTQYSVGVVGDTVVGMGVSTFGSSNPSLGTDTPTPIELDFESPKVRLYDGSGAADCQDKYDGTGNFGGETILYDRTGVAIDAGGGGTIGTGAICIFDGGENIFQIALTSPTGQPKVRKYLAAAVAPGNMKVSTKG